MATKKKTTEEAPKEKKEAAEFVSVDLSSVPKETVDKMYSSLGISSGEELALFLEKYCKREVFDRLEYRARQEAREANKNLKFR